MENKNLPAERPTTDIIGKNAADLKEFMDAGMPGIGAATDELIVKMFDMYVYGKNYRQISGIFRCPKVVILYLSSKLHWFEKRQEYLDDLKENRGRRAVETVLMAEDFLINTIQMWQKKINAKMTRYMMTDDEKFSDQINLKEMDRFMKALEILQKMNASPSAPKGPLVGINVGEGAVLTRTGENSIEVTPKQKAVGNMLKELADMRRAEEEKEKP